MMANITSIKSKILELAPAPFQEFCDVLIKKERKGEIHGFGMKVGTGKTTTGNPDSYMRKDNGKYICIAYTTQQKELFTKLKEDIEKCMDKNATGLDLEDIDEIICCHTSDNLRADYDKKLHEMCESNGIYLTIWGIDELANLVYGKYRIVGKDILGINISTAQILSIEDFVKKYDEIEMAAPITTVFQFRENEKLEIIKSIEENSVVMVTGKAGVGKTRLVLEVIRNFEAKGFNVFCVKNNGLEIYDDLISCTEAPGNYLFFVDDANELIGLHHIVEYISKKDLGYTVKVVVTVRNYVRDDVKAKIEKFVIPKIIEIDSFSDDEIKEFIVNNTKIRNLAYINQIIRIAEGSPRLAYMAGKLAIEKNKLSAIEDVSDLYDLYYREYVDKTIDKDRDLYFSAGLLSISKIIELTEINMYENLLEVYGMTCDEFEENIRQLAEKEVAEIQLGQVAKLTDQCFSNYMLYYVFIEKKMVPFSDVISIGYEKFQRSLKNAINDILHIFYSEDTCEYCQQEIIKVWDQWKNSNNPQFESFARCFHVFKPLEGFQIAKEKIEKIESKKFDGYSIDLSNNAMCFDEKLCIDGRVLEFIKGYQYDENFEYVMELLIEFSLKNEYTFLLGCNWLRNNYGIDIESEKYGYCKEKAVSEYLLNAIQNGDKNIRAFAFKWAINLLKFKFQKPTEDRKQTMILYTIYIKKNEGVLEYRKACWEILMFLSNSEESKKYIILFFESYFTRILENDREVLEFDFQYLEKILCNMESEDLCYLKIVNKMMINARKLDFEVSDKWNDLLKGEKWEFYQLFEDDFSLSDLSYKDYELKKKEDILQYGQNILVSDIPGFVNRLDLISKETPEREAGVIIERVEMIIREFDEEYLETFLDAFIDNDCDASIDPNVVLERLNKTKDSKKLLLVIKQKDFSQKNQWLYSFFETLPKEKVNHEMLEELYEFLNNDSDSDKISRVYRGLKFLKKFLSIEQNIYPLACRTLYEKYQSCPKIVEMYLRTLFRDDQHSPSEILNLFKEDLSLLRNIYFNLMKNDAVIDMKGDFLIRFLQLGEDWMKDYAEVYWSCADDEKHDYQYKNRILWESDNYIRYFDFLFDHFPEIDTPSGNMCFRLKNTLISCNDEEIIDSRQKEWVKHIVCKNAFLPNRIVIIFEIVVELDDEYRREAIITLLKTNADFKVFDKIRLCPYSYSGGRDIAQAYQNQIDFLESLYPEVNGLKYLEHKKKIESVINFFKNAIKQERINEIKDDALW